MIVDSADENCRGRGIEVFYLCFEQSLPLLSDMKFWSQVRRQRHRRNSVSWKSPIKRIITSGSG